MAELVYLLCAGTSLMCAFLLFRGYQRTRAAMLIWSSHCFLGFAVNNLLLLVDLSLFPDVDLLVARVVPAQLGLCALIYGLVKESSI